MIPLTIHHARAVALAGTVLLVGGCAGTSSTGTTSSPPRPVTTTTITVHPTPTEVAPVPAVTVTVPPPAPAAPVAAPCTSEALFGAAAAREGFTADDPGYTGENQPGASRIVCADGYAFAWISRPIVGTTDGATFFKDTGGTWSELGHIYPPSPCISSSQFGIPIETALKLTGDQYRGGVGPCG